MTRETRARFLAVLPYAAIAAVTVGIYVWLVAAQSPKLYFDSSVYLESAAQPWSWSHLFYPKPPMVPLVYRAIGTNPHTIVAVQAGLAVLAWTALAAALASVLERRWLRIAAVAVAAVFVLAPSRVGYTHLVLSESITDSIQTFAYAAAILLATALGRDPASGRAKLLAAGLLVLAVAWMWTRDTNAVVVLLAVPILLVARWRQLRRARWLLVPAMVAVASASGVIWSTTVIPPPTQLTVHRDVPQDFTARKTYPTFNNISDRLRDPEAVAFFVEHGMPQAELLVKLGAKDQQIFLDPQYAPARLWIAEHASGVYIQWLLRHPIDHTMTIVSDPWTFLGVHNQHVYMPQGWTRSKVRGVTDNKIFLVLLLVAFPLALWRSLHRPLSLLALVLVTTGAIACAASYYGDSLERARHCYAAGQQLIFGLVLAVLARFAPAPRSAAERAEHRADLVR